MSSSHLSPPPYPPVEPHTTPIRNPFPCKDIRYYGDQNTGYPPPWDDVQYHPGGQGHVYGKERKTPDAGYPNWDRYQAPPGHPNQQGWNPYQPPPPPSQGGRSDGSADPYQDDQVIIHTHMMITNIITLVTTISFNPAHHFSPVIPN